MLCRRLFLLAAVGLLSLLVACDSTSGTERIPVEYDFTGTLQAAVNQVIVPTYTDLAQRAATLKTACATLKVDKTEVNLEAARAAWVAARVPWEQSEGFLFGPVSDGLDPAMDTWPVDHNALDNKLNSAEPIDEELLANTFAPGLKGFHTIEYLLWGENTSAKKTAAQITAREFDYLTAATHALAQDTATLLQRWTTDGFARDFLASGTASGVHTTQMAAVEELIGGIVEICNEVANGKIAEPYASHDPRQVESQFSHNSLEDFSDNIRSIRNIYFGALGATPAAENLSVFVASLRPDLDTQARAQIEASIAALEAIAEGNVTFRDAINIPSKAPAIEAAQAAINKLGEQFAGIKSMLYNG